MPDLPPDGSPVSHPLIRARLFNRLDRLARRDRRRRRAGQEPLPELTVEAWLREIADITSRAGLDPSNTGNLVRCHTHLLEREADPALRTITGADLARLAEAIRDQTEPHRDQLIPPE